MNNKSHKSPPQGSADPPPAEQVTSHKYKKILMVRLDRLGDVILSTPAIKAVRDAYPKSYIAFMARPYVSDVVIGNPYLDEVVVYDKDSTEEGLLGNLKFIQRLSKKRFDVAFILHPTVRTHLITYLSGIPERIGYAKKLGMLLTKKIPHTKQFGLKHELDYTLDVVRYAGIEPFDNRIYMPIAKTSEKKVEEIFASNGLDGTDMVVTINPGASCPSKRWPAANFAEVSDRLVERYKARIVIAGDTGDRPFADEVSKMMKKSSLNLTGTTSVADLASVLKRSRLFISNDSGPVHMSCALGIPAIVIFGRKDRGLSPGRWGPTGIRSKVLHKDVGCDTCLAHNCGIGFRCLAAITPEDVLNAAADLLDSLR